MGEGLGLHTTSCGAISHNLQTCFKHLPSRTPELLAREPKNGAGREGKPPPRPGVNAATSR